MARGPWTPPPNWPKPEPGWEPHPGWNPDPRWGPPPPGWDFYPDRTRRAATSTAAEGAGISWWRRRWLQLVAAGLVGLLIGASTASGADTSPTADHPTAAVTATTTVTPAPPSGSVSKEEADALRARVQAAEKQQTATEKAKTRATRKLHQTQATLRASKAAKNTAVAARDRAQAAASAAKGGQFCPNASAGMTGYDADGDAYVCRDGHWEN